MRLNRDQETAIFVEVLNTYTIRVYATTNSVMYWGADKFAKWNGIFPTLEIEGDKLIINLELDPYAEQRRARERDTEPGSLLASTETNPD